MAVRVSGEHVPCVGAEPMVAATPDEKQVRYPYLNSEYLTCGDRRRSVVVAQRRVELIPTAVQLANELFEMLELPAVQR